MKPNINVVLGTALDVHVEKQRKKLKAMREKRHKAYEAQIQRHQEELERLINAQSGNLSM